MIRKLLLPAVAIVLLGGCVSAGYNYRQGNGDYYHGRPSVEYRYYSPYPYGYYGPSTYGGYRYGYPYGGGYRYGDPYGYRNYYGYPYRLYQGYPYGNPYYQRRPMPHVHPRIDPTPDINRSHWRNLDGLRRRNRTDPGEAITPRAIVVPQMQPQPRFNPAPDDNGSALGGRVRRAREAAVGDETTP